MEAPDAAAVPEPAGLSAPGAFADGTLAGDGLAAGAADVAAADALPEDVPTAALGPGAMCCTTRSGSDRDELAAPSGSSALASHPATPRPNIAAVPSVTHHDHDLPRSDIVQHQ